MYPLHHHSFNFAHMNRVLGMTPLSLPTFHQNGWTPLMTSSFEGHTEVVRELIGAEGQDRCEGRGMSLLLPETHLHIDTAVLYM